MLTAEQIRIGNTVLYNDIIFNIWSIGNNSTPKRQSYYVDLDCEEKDIHLKGIDINEIKPIELTKEWLLKMGLKWSEEHKVYYNNGFNIEKIDEMLLERRYGIILKHVHQVQNFYNIVTNQELTIK